MKKIGWNVLVAFVLCFMVLGCATSPSEKQSAKEPVIPKDDADEMVIVDWANRNIGESKAPIWLIQLSQGNSSVYKTQFGIDPNRDCEYSPGEGKTEPIAQVLSRTNFAYKKSDELNKSVIAKIGKGLNDGELEAYFTVASKTQVTMAGLREEGSFWQKVRIKNNETKVTTEKYNYYTIFSWDKTDWNNMLAKYFTDIIGNTSISKQTRKEVYALYDEMKSNEDKKEAQVKSAEDKEYQLQLARIEAARAKNGSTQPKIEQPVDYESALKTAAMLLE